jgi:acyl-CoA:acyl-CoA alkyltransferase
MRYTNVCLHDFGYELPPVLLSSAAIEERLQPLYERLKLPAGRLELMTGIESRRLWESGTRPSAAAAAAGAAAIAKGQRCQSTLSPADFHFGEP